MGKQVDDYNQKPNKCLMCGENILHHSGRLFDTKRKKFCSRKCSAMRQIKKEKTKIDRKLITDNLNEKRINNGYRGFIKHTQLKRLLIKIRGHRCENCGICEWVGRSVPIELHHIDGDSLNNSIDNLLLICPNCHTFTDNYKSKNKHSTRDR